MIEPQTVWTGSLSRLAWLQLGRKGLIFEFVEMVKKGTPRAEVDAWMHSHKVWGFYRSPLLDLDLESPAEAAPVEARRQQARANLTAREAIEGWFTRTE